MSEKKASASRYSVNDQDQWSASLGTLRSKKGQQLLASYHSNWAKDEDLSWDELLDEVISEICERNRGELFDYNSIYIDLDTRRITDDLRGDTRHQVGRLLAKAKQKPRRRLQLRLVNLHMWFDLAMKCREARRVPGE